MAFSFVRRYFKATLRGLVGPLKVLRRYRELMLLLVRRDLAVRTSGTIFGSLWILVQPALQIFTFWFLLDFILNVDFPGDVTFLEYFLVGMLPWLFVVEVLSRSLNILREFGDLYARAQFPLLILPMLPMIVSGTVYGIVYFCTVLILHGPAAAMMTPLVMLSLMVWLLPFCYLLAIGGLFLRDIAQAFPFMITIAMYLTPIMYMPDMLPAWLKPLTVLNPFADMIAAVHGVVQQLSYSNASLIRLTVLWLILVGPAWVLFNRSQPHIREAL